MDDAASELIDPDFDRPLLRPVAPLAQLEFDEPETPAPAAPVVAGSPSPRPQSRAAPRPRGKPAVPAWEDVLLGVRSSGQR